MEFFTKNGVAWVIVIIMLIIAGVIFSGGRSMMDITTTGNGELSKLSSEYDGLKYGGFKDGEIRTGSEVIGLIDDLKGSNNPRMRAVVTTRSGDTTTYGYATTTSDTYIAYEETDKTDDDYIVPNDNYEVEEILTGSNDVLVGFELEYTQ